jgi:hypothetical protein
MELCTCKKQPIHKVSILTKMAKGCRRDATTCFKHTFQLCMGKGLDAGGGTIGADLCCLLALAAVGQLGA